MSTSGSYDFTVDRDTIITEAFRKIGACGDTQTPNADQISIGAKALNMMAKTFMSLGLQVWCLKEEQVAMSLFGTEPNLQVGPGEAIDLDYKPLKLLEAQRMDASTVADPVTTPLHRMTNREWQQTAHKKETGVPTAVYYVPGATTGTLHVWPVPDSYWATNGALQIVFQRQVQDWDVATDDPDFPVEWHEALVYQLAVRLAPNYGLPPVDRQQLKKEADEILGLVVSYDQEEGSMYIGIDRS